MAYYVDTGNGQFTQCDDIHHAREIAQHALDAARDFRARMGWTPYWGKCVEIRRGRAGLVGCIFNGCEERNQEIVRATKTHDVLYLKD